MKPTTDKLLKFAFVSLLLMGIVMLYSQNATLIVEEVGDPGAPGQVTVSLIMGENDYNQVSAIEFYIEYDGAVLSYTGYNSFFSTEGSPIVNEPYAGETRVIWVEDYPFGQPMLYEDNTIVVLEYNYFGGYTDINWGLSKGIPGYPEKGQTVMAYWNPFGSSYILTFVNGCIGSGCGDGPIDCTGAASSDWFDGSNWTDGTVPTIADNIAVSAGMPNDPVIAGALAECNNLDIAAGVTFEIAADGSLTAAGTITNEGFIYMTSDMSVNGASVLYDAIAGAGDFQ